MKETIRRPVFVGVYRQSLEVRGRLTLPLKWRPALACESQVFLLAKPNSCLMLLSEGHCREEMHKLEATLSLAADENALHRVALRCLGADLSVAKIDARGRIRIPEKLIHQAGFGPDVVVVGCLAHAEVWPAERWQVQETQSRVQLSEFARQLGL